MRRSGNGGRCMGSRVRWLVQKLGGSNKKSMQ